MREAADEGHQRTLGWQLPFRTRGVGICTPRGSEVRQVHAKRNAHDIAEARALEIVRHELRCGDRRTATCIEAACVPPGRITQQTAAVWHRAGAACRQRREVTVEEIHDRNVAPAQCTEEHPWHQRGAAQLDHVRMFVRQHAAHAAHRCEQPIWIVAWNARSGKLVPARTLPLHDAVVSGWHHQGMAQLVARRHILLLLEQVRPDAAARRCKPLGGIQHRQLCR